jgi:hypothetical protein
MLNLLYAERRKYVHYAECPTVPVCSLYLWSIISLLTTGSHALKTLGSFTLKYDFAVLSYKWKKWLY